MAEGFERFLRAPQVVEAVRKAERKAATAPLDPYDSHPTLGERIAALDKVSQGEESFDARPAVSLLADVSDLERQLVSRARRTEGALRAIRWEDVGRDLYPKLWREECGSASSDALHGLTVGSLAEIRATLGPVSLSLLSDANPKRRHQRAMILLGEALALALLERGWTLRADVGEAIELSFDGHVIRPFSSVAALVDGDMAPEVWAEVCREAGIDGMSLGEGVPKPS